MIQIPKQLDNYRFIKTYRKNAIEKAWVIDPIRFKKLNDGTYKDIISNNIYKSKNQVYKGKINSYNVKEIQEHLDIISKSDKYNITYGVLCGFNGLVVVDIDNKKVADILKDIYPFSNTFTVSSAGKDLPHFYFKCLPYQTSVRFDSVNDKRLLDVQGSSTYVIGANSKLRSNNKDKEYNIINNSEIFEVDFAELINIIEENISDLKKVQKKQKNPYNNEYYILDPISEEIFKKISCDDVLEENNIDISNNPGDTPFANSIGKKCLHRTGYLWFDHHTQQGGDVITLYSKIHNLDYIKAKFDLAEKIGVSEKIFKEALEFHMRNKSHEMTELIASRYISSIPTYTIRSDRQPEIYVYKEGIYVPEGETVIKEFCDNILGKWYNTNIVKKIIDKIMVRTYIDSEDFFKEADPRYIPVQNGVLDLFEKKLLDFSPDRRFFNKLPVVYDKKAKCETTIQHYNKVLNGENDVKVMQELFGYLLYKDYKFEKCFMFFGEGRNGKSKSIEQMKALIGDRNTANFSLQEISKEKFLRCVLHRKLANLADDIGNDTVNDTKIFKQMTGHSYITADRKNKSTISFLNYAKMIFSANKLPKTKDNSAGWWNRWIFLGFNKRFLLKPEYYERKNNNTLKPYHRLADTNLINKLTTSKELSGVLNWALEGLQRLINNDGFFYTDSAKIVRKTWERHTSTVISFSQDHIEKTCNPDDYIETEELYEKYLVYCRDELEEVADTFRDFNTELQKSIIRKRKHIAIGYEYRWIGVKYK